VASEDAVRRARPRPDVFFRLKSVDGYGMAYVVADGGDARGMAKSRFFFPSGAAVIEDPATGSACANLGGWFTALRPGADIERIVHQGDEIERPSTLHLSVRAGAIFVGGDVIDLARGSLEP
jgi:predicted PhzF superfamily epimerase YddE/YHI9